jgi:putative nucleotidyltransferase with HDIG domain
MHRNRMDSALRNEEQRTVAWFVTLFYLILVIYDIFYYFIRPKFQVDGEIGFPNFFSYIVYIIMFALIPIVFYFNKNNKEYVIKYLYSVLYLVLTIINDITYYFGTDMEFKSANIVEMFVIFFAPIFVNSRFFWTVSIGTIFKYAFLTIVLKDFQILNGIIIVFVVTLISYILLNRFRGYVSAVKYSYDQQLEGIVKGVIATLELKDPYTRGHSERVAHYAQILAKELEVFTSEELKVFNYACLLHDIGKINIPDQILMKPNQLTKEEYEIIKTHPIVGAEAVKDVEGIASFIDVIRSHHERWDGTGYPDQLKGSEIALLARVVSIADAFDAMTSSRSYRAAMPLEVAYDRIIQGEGTQFDPELVKVFKKVFPKWTNIHNKYQ